MTERSGTQDARGEDMDRLAAMIAVQNDVAMGAIPLEALLQAVLERATTLTNAHGAAIEMIDGEESVLTEGWGSAANRVGLRLRLESSLSGMAARAGMVVHCDNAATDERADAEVCRTLSAMSLILAPLYLDGGFRGVLEVLASEPHAFRDRDVHTVQIMAALASAAISRSPDKSAERTSPGMPTLEVVQYATLHDTASGLPNRALLHDRLAQGLLVARREDAPLAALAMDIGNWDELAEEEDSGTRVIRTIAERLQETLRASDTVARVAADAFVVLLPGANAIGAVGTAKKIQRSLKLPVLVNGQSRELHLNIGVAIFPEHGEDPDIILERAHAALAGARTAEGRLEVFGA